MWQYLACPWTVYQEWDPEYATVDKPKQWGLGVLFDIIELLHRDAAALPGEDEHDYDREAGQRMFRDAVNPTLAQLEPPKVLTDAGQIMEVADVAKDSITAAIVRCDGRDGDTPALTDDVYEHILTIIKRVGNGMELAPATYVRLGEEARRDIYLVTLNTHYENQTAGEAFNHGGKTDLRVRHEGDNVFVGECKIWHGPKTFTDALDQLFGYAAWRDTKLALIMFVPNQKMSDVITEAESLVEQHAQVPRVAERSGQRPPDAGPRTVARRRRAARRPRRVPGAPARVVGRRAGDACAQNRRSTPSSSSPSARRT